MNGKTKYEPQNPQLDFIFNLLPNKTQMEDPNESVKADRQGREGDLVPATNTFEKQKTGLCYLDHNSMNQQQNAGS